MVQAKWNDRIIAESDQTIKLEDNHYFPRENVSEGYLEVSQTKTHCPWKGEASYFHIKVEGDKNEDAAWYYPNPKDAASQIKDHVAFWKGVEVNEVPDREKG